MTGPAPVVLPLPAPLTDAPPESPEKIPAGSAEIDPAFRVLLAHLLPPRAAVGQVTLPAAVVDSASPAPERAPDPSGPDAVPVPLPPAQTALAALLLAMASVPAPPPPVSPPSPEPAASEPRPAPNGRPALPSAVEATIMNSAISTKEPVEIRGSSVTPVVVSDRSGRAPVVRASASDALGPAAAGDVEAPPAPAAPDAVLPPVPARAPSTRREVTPPISTESVRPRDPEPAAPRLSVTVRPPDLPDAGGSGSVTPAPPPHASVTTRALISTPPAEAGLSVKSRPADGDREPVTTVRAGRHVEPITAVHVEEATAEMPAGVHADSDTTAGGGTEQDRGPETRQDPGPSFTVETAGVAAPAPRAAAVEETAGPEVTSASRSVVRQVVAGIGRLRPEGRHEVSLRLDPPELGAVRIEAVLTGPHLTLQIHASLPATRDALEQALPRLRESLAEHGIVPAQVTVDLGLDGSSRRFGGEGFAPPAPPTPAFAAPARIASPARWLEARGDGVDLWV